jgi:hypothetical protein
MPQPAIPSHAGRLAPGAALLLAAIWLPAMAQSTGSAAPAASLYRIAGTVVNAVSGEPVAGATVSVLAESDSHRIALVESGSDGRFQLEGLPAAKYQLTASKRGYCTGFYDQHEEFNSAIVTGEGEDTGSLVFRLTPGAVLRGVVTADGGDPVEGATVLLFEKPRGHEPGSRITEVDTTTTDDTGAYEFAGLEAGEYLLAVKAEPWYAMHWPSAAQRPTATGERNPALDVAYPITYFDSTAEEGSASPIVLAGGNREEANIILHAAPALKLEVQAERKQDGSIAAPVLRQSVFGMVVSGEGPTTMDSEQTGIAEFSGVAPGHYEVMQGDPPRIAELDAATSQQVDPSLGAPTVTVAGTLQAAPGMALAGEAQVTLDPVGADPAAGHSTMRSTSNRGSFSFSLVTPGEWTLRVEEDGMELPVVSIAAGGRTRPGNRLTVQDRPLTLVVAVNRNATRVEGFARKNGQGTAGVMMVLVPKDAAAFPALARRDQSDSDGSFALLNVVPGSYTVVAIENGWDLDWTRPEVIGRYLPGGTGVTVTGRADNVVRLAGPVAVQPR